VVILCATRIHIKNSSNCPQSEFFSLVCFLEEIMTILPHRNLSSSGMLLYVQTESGVHPAAHSVGMKGTCSELKWPKREAKHFTPSRVEVKNTRIEKSSSLYVLTASDKKIFLYLSDVFCLRTPTPFFFCIYHHFCPRWRSYTSVWTCGHLHTRMRNTVGVQISTRTHLSRGLF